MTNVICLMEDCIHRSKKAMRKYKLKNGRSCHKCTLEFIAIHDETLNSEIFEVVGKDLPCCQYYQKEDDSTNERK